MKANTTTIQPDPTCAEMTREFMAMQENRYEICMANVYLSFDVESDIVGVRKSGFIDEIEVKVTRADYLADFNKVCRGQLEKHKEWKSSPRAGFVGPRRAGPLYTYYKKHDLIAKGEYWANYFYFMVPEEMADISVPDHAGLLVGKKLSANRVILREAKKAPRLHGRRISAHNKMQLAMKGYQRYKNMILNR